jgi:hypothetical protein
MNKLKYLRIIKDADNCDSLRLLPPCECNEPYLSKLGSTVGVCELCKKALVTIDERQSYAERTKFKEFSVA